MGQKIIQWNCRGLKAKIASINNVRNPTVICSLKIFLKPGGNITIKNYQLFNYIYNSRCRASRRVSVLIRNDIPYSKVNIKTNIQAVAIKATLHKAVNICSIYIPPSDDIDENQVKRFSLMTKMNTFSFRKSKPIFFCRFVDFL